LEENQLVEEIDELVRDAVKIRLRSDVPVGAFLSGGLDSSLVCAVSKLIFNQSLDTFSIGFNQIEFDESNFARRVAELFGLKNRVDILEADITSMWPDSIWHCDQPHGDISFIPTKFLSKVTSENAGYKVVLTGDGGDELFAGYTKYFSVLNNAVDSKAFFSSLRLFSEKDISEKLFSVSFKKTIQLNSVFDEYCKTLEAVSAKDDINKVLFFDMKQLLPGNNLVKPDKMAMAHSLETRSPLLDYRLFEKLMMVPGEYKLKKGQTKYIMKKLCQKYLPDDIIYRKKQMFTVPVGEWFKDSLSNYVYDLFNSKSFKDRGIFEQNYVSALTELHVSGKINATRELRAIIAIEHWYRKFID